MENGKHSSKKEACELEELGESGYFSAGESSHDDHVDYNDNEDGKKRNLKNSVDDSSQSSYMSATHPVSSCSSTEDLDKNNEEQPKRASLETDDNDALSDGSGDFFDADNDLDDQYSFASGYSNISDDNSIFRLPDGIVLTEAYSLCAEAEAIINEACGRSHPAGSTSQCLHSSYGNPLPPEEVAKLMPRGEGGTIYIAKIVPDECQKNGQVLNYLTRKDFDEKDKTIKPRRPSLPVAATDFFSSLVRVDDELGSRWIFNGVLNGWPALQCLELVEIHFRRKKRMISRRALMEGRLRRRRAWSAEKEGKQGIPPHFPENNFDVRAVLRMAPWSAFGWTKESPGYLFWFESQRRPTRLTYGQNIVRQVQKDREAGESIPTCQKVHMISHRYAMGEKGESNKDKLTYHTIVLLEWDHDEYCTLVEMGITNGVGGWGGKSSWYDDMMDKIPSLYRNLPPEMIAPWSYKYGELRCYDIKVANVDELMNYIKRYTGPYRRFLDPHRVFSHDARLTFRSKEHIAQYLLNYIGRDRRYSELNRNCQTFCADLCGFIAGKKDVEPFHPLNRVDYTNRSYQFLYDWQMYKPTGR